MTDVAVLAWDDLAEGMAIRLPFVVADEDMAAFARLSGDFNPLHQDPAFARDRGFAGRVVYGGLLVAQVSRLLGMHIPGRDGVWTGLKIDFRAPLMVGEPAWLDAEIARLSEAVRLVRVKFAIAAGDRQIASGTAESQLPVPADG